MPSFLSPSNFTEDTFVGVIELFEKEHSVFNGEEQDQYHLAVRPLAFALTGGKGTGQFHSYYRLTTRPNSVLGKFSEAMEKAGIRPEQPQDLIGVIAVWAQRSYEFGKGMKSREVLIPVSKATEAEIEEANARRASRAEAPAPGTAAPEAVQAAVDFDPETLAKVATAVSGQDVKMAVTKLTGKFDKAVLQAWLNGSLRDRLVADGLIRIVEGKVERVQ